MLRALPVVVVALAILPADPVSGGKKPDPVPGLVKRLASEKAADRVEAARELGKLGKAATDAARGLCELAVASDGEVRAEALEALEKIAPPFHALVVTLLVDRDEGKQAKAVAALASAGATAGTPAILKSLGRVENGDVRRAITVALVDLEPSHPRTFDAALALTKKSDTAAFGIALLADLGVRHPSSRKRAAAVVTEALDPKGKYPISLPTVINAACVLNAKDAVPFLRKLKLHDDEEVRKQATAAFQQLSTDTQGGAVGGPKAAAGALAKGEGGKSYEVVFRAGGVAMVWVAGDSDAVAKVEVTAPDGASVGVAVEGYVFWRPAREGVHRIHVETVEAFPGRFRIKHN